MADLLGFLGSSDHFDVSDTAFDWRSASAITRDGTPLNRSQFSPDDVEIVKTTSAQRIIRVFVDLWDVPTVDPKPTQCNERLRIGGGRFRLPLNETDPDTDPRGYSRIGTVSARRENGACKYEIWKHGGAHDREIMVWFRKGRQNGEIFDSLQSFAKHYGFYFL